MGASFYVQAESRAEADALESEGAPEFHVTYGTASLVLDAIGVEFDYCGTIPVDDLPAAAEAARAEAPMVDFSHGKGWALTQFADVAEAAYRLRRAVAWS